MAYVLKKEMDTNIINIFSAYFKKVPADTRPSATKAEHPKGTHRWGTLVLPGSNPSCF